MHFQFLIFRFFLFCFHESPKLGWPAVFSVGSEPTRPVNPLNQPLQSQRHADIRLYLCVYSELTRGRMRRSDLGGGSAGPSLLRHCLHLTEKACLSAFFFCFFQSISQHEPMLFTMRRPRRVRPPPASSITVPLCSLRLGWTETPTFYSRSFHSAASLTFTHNTMSLFLLNTSKGANLILFHSDRADRCINLSLHADSLAAVRADSPSQIHLWTLSFSTFGNFSVGGGCWDSPCFSSIIVFIIFQQSWLLLFFFLKRKLQSGSPGSVFALGVVGS